ncbi:creatininase family protein [Kaistia dalseonensis]|uniref:Creatinine amidohydrolase n=1 Tax=Kaistia dalseonensis TaxID=410840 RepID=A0ABU0HAW8_9HYPH|nr:creatininase family protein [Kaistia dalseonensis]MCX5496785.1 creatininase family protein [Kaistia dalseonensis]MDQ0439410.1 creatinine amidohydrolase [Kaistia dalseonensis]
MLDLHAATSPEVKSAIEKGAVAVLAVGAQEQHGAHLPLSTDTVMSQGVARRIAGAIDGLLLPPIAYGDAWNNEGFAGTLSLSPDTMRAIFLDLGRGLARSGFKALIIVNGHFGNREPIALAARMLKAEIGFPVMHLDYPGMERIAGEICDSEPAAPTFYHADEVETSMMLALAPDLVRMEKAAPEYPVFPAGFGTEPIGLDSFNRSGVFGDPRPATAEKGEILIAGIAEESVKMIRLFLAKLG